MKIVRILIRDKFLKFKNRDEYTVASFVVSKHSVHICSFCHLCRLHCRSLLFVIVSDSAWNHTLKLVYPYLSPPPFHPL